MTKMGERGSVGQSIQKEIRMKIRHIFLATLAITVLTAGVSFAQRGSHLRATVSGGAAGLTTIDDTENHQISAKDLKARLDKGEKITVIDARHELDGKILKGAIHVPVDNIEDWAKGANKKTVIVTYCTCPHDEAAESEMHTLRGMGFENAFTLSGGLDAAVAAGIEVVTPTE